MKAIILNIDELQAQIDELEPIVKEADGSVYSFREIGEMDGELATLKKILSTGRQISVVESWDDVKISDHPNGVIIQKK